MRETGRQPGRGFSLPLPNGPRCRCRRLSPAGAGGAGTVDTPSRRVFLDRREEAPERRLVLHGAGVPSGPAPRDAAGSRLPAPGPAHAVSRACELRPAAWQPQVRRQGRRVPLRASSQARPSLSPRALSAPRSPPSAVRLPTLSASLARDLCSFCSFSQFPYWKLTT